MSNTDSRPIRIRSGTKKPSVTFPEWFVVLNGCLPLVILAYDARYHQLGPDPIRNSLHTTGALGLLLLMMTLAVSPVRSLTGWNGIVLYRRSLGLVAFLYSLLHIGIYVVHDQAGEISTAWNEILSRRYLQVGLVAFGLLVPLAMTSTPTMVRWLGFRRWKILHRMAYLATALVIIHQYLQSRIDVRIPILLAVVLTMLLGFRLGKAKKKKVSMEQKES